jgi:hypothetical protein
MQEQDGWARLVTVAVHRLGNIQQIIQTKRLGELELSLHDLERKTSLPGGSSTRIAQWRLFLWHARIVRGRYANGQVGFPGEAMWNEGALSAEARAHPRDGTDESPYRSNALGSIFARRIPGVMFGARVSGTLPQRGSLCPPNTVFPARRRKLHAGTRALPSDLWC